MNELCNTLYGNGKGVQQARALNVDDVNKICGIPEITPYTSLSSSYGSAFLTIFSNWPDGTISTGRTIRSTVYYYSLKNYINTESTIYNVLNCTRKSWLASTSIQMYINEDTGNMINHHFHVRNFFNGSVGSEFLFHSDGWVKYFSYSVIPVVVLDSGVLTTG